MGYKNYIFRIHCLIAAASNGLFVFSTRTISTTRGTSMLSSDSCTREGMEFGVCTNGGKGFATLSWQRYTLSE